MKNLNRFPILLLTLVLLCSFTLQTEKVYVGKWEGKDQGDIGFLTLTSDGYAVFEFDGQTMGGKSFKHRTIDNASMRYVIDEKSQPFTIDFIIINNENNEEIMSSKGIISIKSTDEMELALNFSGTERPKDFSENNITFARYKE